MNGRRLGAFVAALALSVAAGCGEEGLFPSTVERGPDFNIAEVAFDEGYFYCRVEPVLFAQSCGAGDPGQGDPSNGCHHSVTSFRLTDYMPLVADSCSGVVPGPGSIPAAARQNYQTSQVRMRRNPDIAPLLLRPTNQAQHPREIFAASSPEADVIRQWATQFSTQ